MWESTQFLLHALVDSPFIALDERIQTLPVLAPSGKRRDIRDYPIEHEGRLRVLSIPFIMNRSL
jgi:hypothetical protein